MKHIDKKKALAYYSLKIIKNGRENILWIG